MKIFLIMLAAIALGVGVAMTAGAIDKQVKRNDLLAGMEKERAALEVDKSRVASEISGLEHDYQFAGLGEGVHEISKNRLDRLQEERFQLIRTMSETDHAGTVATAQYRLKALDEELAPLKKDVAKGDKQAEEAKEKRATISEELSHLQREAVRVDLRLREIDRMMEAEKRK